MYRHHEESLKIMEDYFRKRKEVIALIFGGSVAKGNGAAGFGSGCDGDRPGCVL